MIYKPVFELGSYIVILKHKKQLAVVYLNV